MRRHVLSAFVAAAIVAVGASAAWAQVQVPILPPPGGTTTTTMNPLLPPSTTTTTSAPPPGSTTTTTTAPPAAPAPANPAPPPAPDAPPGAPPAPAFAGEGDGEAPSTAGQFPPELRALSESVQRTPASSTRQLLDALRPLVDTYGLADDEVMRIGFGRFPVEGPASYTHDWWFPRFGPGWRLHQGTDIFAAAGTPVRAPVEGVVRLGSNGLGGQYTYVTQDDGTYVYLAHLRGWPEGLVTGQRVTIGTTVGYVGTSGNARTTPPHLHIEIHPGGGRAADPKAILDGWLADAVEQVPLIVGSFGARLPAVVESTAATRRLAVTTGQVPSLWVPALAPSGAGIDLAKLATDLALRAAARR